MPNAPKSWYWHVRDWKPTGKQAYEQVRQWRRGTCMVLMIEECGVEQHLITDRPGKSFTRWRRATVNDVCNQILNEGRGPFLVWGDEMSDSEHTPGPWRNNGSHINSTAGLVAQFWTNPSVADATLMIAAPDMLEILKTTAGNIRSLGPAGALAQVYEPYTKWLERVDAVIAKAEGRTP